MLTLDVESLAYGGRGVARHNGFVVFVAGALPGDRVRAEVTKAKRAFAEAQTVELLQPSDDRVPDRCLHEGEPCPGAPWQGLAYERQLQTKAAQVDDALRRIGDLDGYELEPIEPAVEAGATATSSSTASASATARSRSASTPAAAGTRWSASRTACSPRRPATRPATGSATGPRRRGWTPTTSAPGPGCCATWSSARAAAPGSCRPGWSPPGQIARPPVDLHTTIEGPSGGTEGPTGVLGERAPPRRSAACGCEISPFAFFQTNTEMAERLYAIAGEYAGLTGTERVFDLYCGIGTLGLTMAARAGEVWGLEIVPEAIDDAARQRQINGISNARFLAANARTGIRPLIEEAGRPDVVVVDPPRAGLSQKIVRRLIECEAPRIVYVSCNPTTLAPNAAQLTEAGYRLRRVRPVDMFPQTPHIECVALLEKDSEQPGFGVAAGLDAEVAAPLAERCAQLGYSRCGPTTIRPPTAWRPLPSSPSRRPKSTSGSP